MRHARVADHHQPLRLVVVEAEQLLLVDALERLAEVGLPVEQAEQLEALLVGAALGLRILRARLAAHVLDGFLAAEEQRPHRVLEAQPADALHPVRDPGDVTRRERGGSDGGLVRRALEREREHDHQRASRDHTPLVAAPGPGGGPEPCDQRIASRTAARNSSPEKAPWIRSTTRPLRPITKSAGSLVRCHAVNCGRGPLDRSLSL